MAARHGCDGCTVRRVAAPTAIPLPSLQTWRIRRGLTQQELAEKAGIRRATIVQIEAGGPARVKTIGVLGRALDCTVDDLRAPVPPGY
jgi:DNA-binding XRE family transcriptional regulator